MYCLYITSRTEDGVAGRNVRSEADVSPRSCTFLPAVRRVRRTRVQPTARDELAVVASIDANPRENRYSFELGVILALDPALAGLIMPTLPAHP